MMAFGMFSKEMISLALEITNNNQEKAKEYLMSGISISKLRELATN